LEGKCVEKCYGNGEKLKKMKKARMKIFENCLEYVTKAGEAYAKTHEAHTL
jgi:hypothetical protein